VSYIDIGWTVLGVLAVLQLGSIATSARQIISSLQLLMTEIQSINMDIQALRARHAPQRFDYPS
jgi:hypothetical protein